MVIVQGRKVGIWLDHRGAVLVEVGGALVVGHEPELRVIESGVEDQVKHLGRLRHQPPEGGPRTGSGAAEAKRLEHRRDQEMREFLARVLDAAVGAERLAVLGPGSAPRELEAALSRDGRFKGASVVVEPWDGHLRAGEAVERFRELLGESAPRRASAGSDN